jgi:hypothetical protein
LNGNTGGDAVSILAEILMVKAGDGKADEE